MLAPELEQRITELISAEIPTVFLIDIQLKKGRQQVLSIKVDKVGGISLAECATINRMLGRALENEADFNTAYTLEVSSPGIGYPLKLRQHYINNIGRQLSVKYKDGTIVAGDLKQVEEDYLILAPLSRKKGKKKGKKGKTREEDLSDRKIFFDEIIESKVIIV